MTSVRIVADGGCDLPLNIVSQYQITIVPVYVTLGPDVLSSDLLPPEEFWARVAQSPYAPKTSGPPPGAFQKVFDHLVSAGYDVVCLTLPGNYSGTFNAAWLAAKDFDGRVRVVDSGSFSLGIGLLVLHAARDALAGRSAESIQHSLESLRERTSVLFVLETLEWVRRGGRLDRIMPLIDRVARTLRVRPVLELTNGELHLVGLSRSTRAALDRLEDELRAMPVLSAAVAYTLGQEAAQELAERMASLFGKLPQDIMLAQAGAVFAAHAGPGAFGAAIVRSH